MTRMRHGVIILPEHRWDQAHRFWMAAERLGFDHSWTYDHLMWRSLRDHPWFGTIPSLTAAATVTSRIALGTMVASPSLRHPVPFAKELMTLDDISGGRLIAGIGAGAPGFDDRVLGGEGPGPVDRARRFNEFVELLDLLLRQPDTTYRGRFFAASEARMRPGCVQVPRVPFAVAATGPRGMRLAARQADIWVTAGPVGWAEPIPFEEAVPLVRKQREAVEQACLEVGRDPGNLRSLVVTGAMISGVLDSVQSYQDAAGLFGSVGFTDMVVHWPRETPPYKGRREVVEEIAAAVLGAEERHD